MEWSHLGVSFSTKFPDGFESAEYRGIPAQAVFDRKIRFSIRHFFDKCWGMNPITKKIADQFDYPRPYEQGGRVVYLERLGCHDRDDAVRWLSLSIPKWGNLKMHNRPDGIFFRAMNPYSSQKMASRVLLPGRRRE